MPTPANPPTCAACGYDLTGVADTHGWHCPECNGTALRPDDPRGHNLRLWLRTFNEPWAIAAFLVLLVIGLELAAWWFWRARWSGLLHTFQMGTLGLGVLYYFGIMPIWMVVLGVRFARELPMSAAGVDGPWRTTLVGTGVAAAAYAIALIAGIGLLGALWWLALIVA
ncbi:MAG: hypothetical protein AAF138_02805 [Planctomycetota bacterium]